jgi:hypothetical protein
MRIKMNSLFMKSMASFMAIILLLASFNVLSFAFFKSSIQNEIIWHGNAKNPLFCPNHTEWSLPCTLAQV